MNSPQVAKTPFEAHNSNITSHMQAATSPACKSSQQHNELLVVLFYGVSCMGKTTFSNMMRQEASKKQINFKKISFDEVGGPILKKFREDNPEITDNEEIFFGCWTEIAALFKDKILEGVSKTDPGKNILFIDDGKIDPSVLQKIQSQELQNSHSVKMLAIYPKHSANFQISPDYSVPFSPQLILNLCRRCLTREVHDTMDYNAEKLLQIVISFTILYKNVTCFKNHFLSEAKFTEMLEVPFHQELLANKNSNQKIEEILTLEGQTVFSEFQSIMRNVYLNIKAPFESLKTAETKYLTQLKNFIEDESKISSLDNLLNFGGKGDWMQACENILSHFEGMDEYQKENNINTGN